MSFSERRLDESEELWLGPVAAAIFLEFGWLREPPLTITARGVAAIRVGWGPDELPLALRTKPAGTFGTSSGPGALWWPGRRPTPPSSFTSNRRREATTQGENRV